MSHKPFTELGLSPEVLKAVERMGFEEASPVQSEAIPHLMAGRDVVGQSQTGSGKTAAFGIPAIEMVDATKREVQALVLCPTRELATQVAEEIAKLAHFKKGVRELPIYGGQSYERQFRGLEAGPQIVIGTPGRVIDHLDRGTLKLESVRLVVLDEADRMLDMGFREDIERILGKVSATRQMVLFSATMPAPIRKLISQYTREPAEIHIQTPTLTVPTIEQYYLEVDWRSKTEVLSRLVDFHDVGYGLIFASTKLDVDNLTEALQARGYNADKLHGDMAQMMRDRVMKRFRERKIELLVATDLAARGLDVDDLEVVFNYELPYDPENYIHRIGRTGRAGKSGRAFSLVGGREFGRLQQIMRFTKARIARQAVPGVAQLEEKSAGRIAETLRETLEKGEYKKQESLLTQLTEAGHLPGDIVSALVHLLNAEVGRPPVPIAEDQPKSPKPERRKPWQEDGGPAHARRERFERPRREWQQREGPAQEGPPREGHQFERPYRERPPYDGPRREGPPRRGFERGGTTPGMVWLRFNLGRSAGVLPGDFVGCIAGESGLPREVIGNIRILPTISLVEVAEANVQQILTAVNGATLKGRPVSAMPGSPPAPEREGPRSPRWQKPHWEKPQWDRPHWDKPRRPAPPWKKKFPKRPFHGPAWQQPPSE